VWADKLHAQHIAKIRKYLPKEDFFNIRLKYRSTLRVARPPLGYLFSCRIALHASDTWSLGSVRISFVTEA